ncbi:hypothetical protein MCOR02_000888 [Pyricularia oryzae]|uniref:Uncharacterized protein n=1 Tax=Pyricularia oryzae TaxID=318829 RepID=A0A4P7NWG1_PYROR|nr:hypothetical protein MCOR02_000888 [Pyricularia oryzae]KAI6258860.1 hypothetical protein MCOR19_004790 [Pyricularia oryzae]KAI6366188.1 hypothetical protein MCOR31_006621 [Pyricularia oryzae]KAI6369825.1 hypothetical protein MCOR32_006568 [Pyricularia oryzae]KAI6409784.1 hypothetical protein MCOR20_004890 [Pyricularia oryzae]
MKLLPGDLLKEQGGVDRARGCEEMELSPINEGLCNASQYSNNDGATECMDEHCLVFKDKVDARLEEVSQELIRLKEKNSQLEEEIQELNTRNQQLQAEINRLAQLYGRQEEDDPRQLAVNQLFKDLRILLNNQTASQKTESQPWSDDAFELCRGVLRGRLVRHVQPDAQLQSSRQPDESSNPLPGPSSSHSLTWG